MNKSESKYFNTARRMDEALLSLLAERELAYITVKELCHRAGVNRSTFYLHYESIADLLDETLSMVNERFAITVPEPGLRSPSIDVEHASPEELFFITDQYLLPYLESVRENRRVYKAIHDQMGTFGAESAYQRFFEAVFSPILSRFGVEREQHEYIMAFYRHGLVAVLMKWVESDCAESPQEIAQIIKRCVGERLP